MTGHRPEHGPAEAYAAALAGLPGIGPARLLELVGQYGPRQAWAQILAGGERRPDPPSGQARTGPRISWADAAAGVNPVACLERMRADGVSVTYLGQDAFPCALRHDPQPPAVLFWIGRLASLENPCVAIVGTRQCTSYGRSMAAELGRDLADAGVCVVSGLALGIDGAAHAGALEAGPAAAGPVGVAASGVDRPYPQRHTELWARVAAAGAVISETAPGRAAQSWRFPARNRIIAGLCRVVVVVESHAGGGSMLTVGAAADRGVDILAVPGPVTSSSSIGTNQLLSEGAGPARHAGDVLAALGDFRPWPPRPAGGRSRPGGPSAGRGAGEIEAMASARDRYGSTGPTTDRGKEGARDGRSTPNVSPMPQQGRLAGVSGPERGTASGPADGMLDRAGRQVLDAVGWTPTSTGVVADRTGLPVGSMSARLMRLEELGFIRGGGGWWERCRQ
jgi:DNA processing protein